MVFLGEGREIESHTGKVDVAARAHGAGRLDAAKDAIALHLIDAHEERAIVDDKRVADRDIIHQPFIIHRGGFLRRGGGVFLAELHHIAFGEIDRLGQVAGADRRTGEVEEHGDVGVALL